MGMFWNIVKFLVVFFFKVFLGICFVNVGCIFQLMQEKIQDKFQRVENYFCLDNYDLVRIRVKNFVGLCYCFIVYNIFYDSDIERS